MSLAAMLLVPMSHNQGGWRHPYSRTAFLDRTFYEDFGRTLEHGMFDMVFMPDILHLPDQYASGFDLTARYGGQGAMQLDPWQVMAAIAGVTSRIGLAATLSATFFPAYQIARSMASLDHLSGGRAAWNVVMSTSDSEAQNFGQDAIPSRQSRYERGDEFMQAVFSLWDSWDDDALVLDKERGYFADPAKVHYVNFRGPTMQVRGPLSVPRCPQGRPLILQAGASPQGRSFAAKWADVVFTIQRTLGEMQDFYRDIKGRAASFGRDPASVKILPGVQISVGETEAIARRRHGYAMELVEPHYALALVSYHTGLDLSTYPPDQPLRDIEVDQGARGSFDVLLRGTEAENLTLKDLAVRFANSELTPEVIGTPAQVADQLQELFTNEGCDGFMLTPIEVPGNLDEVVRSVVPKLQHSGLLRTSYEGATLRDVVGTPLGRHAQATAT
jgi:FMN-dependent oxidoreductase (nitrilotriacetate monooxygenase family)